MIYFFKAPKSTKKGGPSTRKENYLIFEFEVDIEFHKKQSENVELDFHPRLINRKKKLIK